MALSNVVLNDLTGKLLKTNTTPSYHGLHADIWRAVFKTPDSGTPSEVAIKVIRTIFKPEEVKVLNEKLLREARLWSCLDHRYVVPFLGIATDMAFNSAPSLVSPYYRNGSLAQYTRKTQISEPRKWKFLYMIADGLKYLHLHNIIHGDLKPGNILINDQREALLTDFGWSRVLELSGFTTKSTPGTIRYMAPELLDPNPPGGVPVRTSKPADIWALAITATEIFSSIRPYHDIQAEGYVWQFIWQGQGKPQREHYVNHVEQRLWNMLERCWERDPQRRINAGQIKAFLSSL